MSGKNRKHHNSMPVKKNLSQAHQEHSYIIAKKMLRFFNLDPSLLDSFTKKQKQYLLRMIADIPSIKPEKENTIPRQYVKKIRSEMLEYMKTNYAGDSETENQLSYMDIATYGSGFYMLLTHGVITGYFTGTSQEKTAQQIYEAFGEHGAMNSCMGDVFWYLRFLTSSYSQVNFRIYGFHYHLDTGRPVAKGALSVQTKILLTVKDCESKIFTYNNIERKAFRLVFADAGDGSPLDKPRWAVVKRNLIFPKAKEDETFNIYIQSHVLHRFKERADTLKPSLRNFFIQYALSSGLIVASTEKHKFLTCTAKDDLPLGYFTFFIQDDDIVVNTFIPLASEITPEGKKLYEALQLGKEDIKYLGMDKLSFFTDIDFEQIPVLKQALIDSGIWPTKLLLDIMPYKDSEEDEPHIIDMQKTLFVKNFFDKLEEHRCDPLSGADDC